MIIILSILLTITTVTSIFFIFYYRRAVKIAEKLNEPIRYGYYKYSMTINDKLNTSNNKNFDSIIYVKELDRYTNGESKIEIDKINYGVSDEIFSNKRVDKFIRDNFTDVKKTSEIEWLESETSIKEERRKKLKNLKKIFK